MAPGPKVTMKQTDNGGDGVSPAVGVGGAPAGGASDYLRALRPHQWTKNLLVFFPLVAAHDTDPGHWFTAVAMFALFSACASGTYVLNDLLDIAHDRRDENKRRRPIASGRVSPRSAAAVGVALVCGAFAAALWLSLPAGLCIAAYLAVTSFYSLYSKRKIFLDVVTLAVLYVIRVIAGAAAVSIIPSPWLQAFCLFLFLVLAITKRLSEIRVLRASARPSMEGRPYVAEDFTVMAALGAAGGFASAVVLSIYVQSALAAGLYGRPQLLWLICPLLLYWTGRMLLLACRGRCGGDPVLFVLRDKASWLSAVGVALIFAAAL